MLFIFPHLLMEKEKEREKERKKHMHFKTAFQTEGQWDKSQPRN